MSPLESVLQQARQSLSADPDFTGCSIVPNDDDDLETLAEHVQRHYEQVCPPGCNALLNSIGWATDEDSGLIYAAFEFVDEAAGEKGTLLIPFRDEDGKQARRLDA